MAVDLGQAFVRIKAITTDMQSDIAKALNSTGKLGDKAGKNIGEGISDQVTKSTKSLDNDISRNLGSLDKVGSTAGRDLGKGITDSASKEVAKYDWGSIGSKISSGLQKAAIPAAVVSGAIGVAARGAMDYASEAEQSYGAVESIFHDHSQAIIDNSKTAADAVGMSGRSYRENAAYMGAMLKNQGVPMEELGKKTAELVALGSDLASTFGGPTEDAVAALGATLRGETDPIERYGVSIKQADIEAKKAAMGLDGLEGEADKAASTQALLALVSEKTADAQGQFARETDTAAHKQQVMKAKIDDAKEAIGTGLLPVMSALSDIGAKVAGVLGDHPRLFIAIAGAVGAVAAAITIAAPIASIITAIAAAASAAGMGMVAFAGSVVTAALPIVGIVAAISAVIAALALFFTKTELGRAIWGKFTQALAAGWDWVKDKLVAGFTTVKDALTGLWDLFVNRDYTGALSDAFGWDEDSAIVDKLFTIRDAFSEVFALLRGGDDGYGALSQLFGEDLADKISTFALKIGQIPSALSDLWQMLKGGDLANGWDGLADLIGVENAEMVFDIINRVRGAFGKIKDSVENLIPTLKNLASSLGGALLAAFRAVWGVVKSVWGVFQALWQLLAPVLVPILKVVAAIVGGVLFVAFHAIMGAIRLVAGVVNLLLQGFTWLLDRAIKPLISFVGKLAGALIGGLGNAISWVTDIVPKLWNGIKDGASGLWGVLTGVWNGIKDGAVGAWNGIIGAITGAWGAVTGAIGGAFSWIQSTLIGPLVSFVTGTLIPAVANIFTTIGDKWNAFKGWLQTIGSDFLAVLQNAWNVVVAFFTGDKEDVYAALGELWESIKTLTTDVWNGIRDALVEVWNSLVGIATTVWTAIKDAIVNTWNGLKDGIASAWQATWGFIVNVWNGIPGFAASVWEAVKNTVVNAWNGMLSFISGIGPAIRDFVANVWAAIKSTSQATWEEIKNVVLNVWSALKAGISNAIQALRDKINSFVNNARDAFGRFVSNVEQVPGKIKAAFANAGTWLLDAGRSIIQGLANGVRNAAGMVEDAIRAVIPDSVERFVPGLHFGGLIPGFARGGVLPSIPGVSNSERDPILGWSTEKKQPIARVEPGEFVVNRAATKKFLPLLAAINGGKLNGRKGDWGLPGFADGGVVGFNDVMKFLRGGTVNGNSAPGSLEGSPYVWGGGLDGNWGDCSGAQSAIAALVAGVDTTGRKFATGSQGAWLGAHGFKRGRSNGKDAFETAYFNGGPWGGHTAGTLFDSKGKAINVEMGGGRGNGQIGGPAAGSRNSQFTDIWWHPLKSAVASALSSGESKVKSTSVDGATVETSEGTQEVDWGTASGLFELAKRGVRLFDTGGLWRSGTLGFNAGPNEHVMSPAQWDKLVEGLKAVADAVKTGNLSYKWIAERFDKRTSELTMEATGGALGGWIADTKLLQDAEKALIETRKKATAENEDVKKAEEKLAKVREDTARDVKIAKEQNKGKKDEDKKNKSAQESAAKKVRKAELELEDARKKAATSTGEYAEEMRAAEAAVAAARKASMVRGFDNGANLKSFAAHGSLSDYAEVTSSVGGLAKTITPLSGLGNVMSGLAGSASSVLKSTDSLKTAYAEQADANAAVVGAEADLKAARMSGDAGKIAESETALSKARSVASKAAVAAGHAEIAAAISVATAVVEIIASVVEWIDAKVQAVLKGMATAWSAISSALGDVAKLAGVAEKLRNQVSGLVIDTAMAAIAVKAAGREMRLSQMDAAVAGIKATVSVAEAQAAFDAQRKADMRAAMTNYDDLSLAYDRFRNGMTDANGEVMAELAAWSDTSHKLYSQLLAAQVNQQIVQRQGEKAALEAAYKHTLAVLDLQNATLSLNVAAKKLAVASGSAFGMDQVGATVGQRYSALMAEKAKLKANNASISTWINPVNWFTTMPAASRRMRQIDEQLKRLEAMDEFKKLEPGALADMQKAVNQAGAMGFFGAGDQIEGMIKNSALGDAGRALEEMDFKNSLIDIQSEQAESRAKIDRAMAELEQKSKIDTLDTAIAGLEREKASHDAWAEYWGTTNKDVRKTLADLAKTNADFATELKEKSREPQTIQLYGDSFDREGTSKLLESLGYRVEKLENPKAVSGDVVASRR